jgi:hypothetical protein
MPSCWKETQDQSMWPRTVFTGTLGAILS